MSKADIFQVPSHILVCLNTKMTCASNAEPSNVDV